MRRITTRALPALLLLLAVGCGEDPARDTARVGEVRGTPLFTPPEPVPEPAPEVAEPETAPETADVDEPVPDTEAAPPDIAIGDPSAPLSEPPPATRPEPEPVPDTSETEPPATETAGEAPDGEAPDETPAPAHTGVVGSGDAPVELKFPDPDEDGVILVTFEQLASFEYLPPGGPKKAPVQSAEGTAPTTPDGGVVDDPTATVPLADALRKGASTIPGPIRKLSGKKIEVEGYMIPLRFEDGKVKSFFLSRHLQGCCFGIVPRVNDVIEVEMVAEGDAYYDAYMPIIVIGPFEVREDASDPAYLQTIYYMKGERSRFAEDW